MNPTTLTLIISAVVTIIVATLNGVQTVILEWMKRKAAPLAREQTANLTVQKLANSGSKFQALSDENMSEPTSVSGIFWHNRAVQQEEQLAAVRRVIFSSAYDAGPKSMAAIEKIMTPKPGESSDISITIPGKDRNKV